MRQLLQHVWEVPCLVQRRDDRANRRPAAVIAAVATSTNWMLTLISPLRGLSKRRTLGRDAHCFPQTFQSVDVSLFEPVRAPSRPAVGTQSVAARNGGRQNAP